MRGRVYLGAPAVLVSDSFLLNYTWSKVLGIRDGQTDNGAGERNGPPRY
jgi:hypothetical protein